ncbi:MAG: STAS-like domain-containing protein [Proteobacteria bacterium]|nr:STAS-like domain-containing protein [Pseudomonadota bacterium]
MTLNKLILKTILQDTGSRESGALLRNKILALLTTYPLIEIDFNETILTPSFADEAFGLLCHNLSYQKLNDSVKFVNLSPSQKALLTRVLANRFSHK